MRVGHRNAVPPGAVKGGRYADRDMALLNG
jgi:hypothetical protein